MTGAAAGPGLIETHCHLDYLKARPLDEILADSAAAGVERLLTIAVSPGNLDAALAIARERGNVWCSQGVHPHEARDWSPGAADRIRANARDPRVVAVGETGLDFHYDRSPRDRQRAAFGDQLDLAAELGLPVVVHARDADGEAAEVLGAHARGLARGGVVHSFTGGEAFARKALDLGLHLGFNGIVTFKNAERVRDAARLCPLDRVLLETDSPFLAPEPHRGRENGPFHLPLVAEAVARAKGVAVGAVLESAHANAMGLFGFPD